MTYGESEAAHSPREGRNERDIPMPVGPEKVTHRGKMIEVVTQEMQIGEKIVNFERARRSPGARLLITSPEGNILLTREYRTEVNDYDFRLPGGKVFDSLEEYSEALEDGDDIIAKSQIAAQKEAMEEVGLQTSELTHLYTSKCGATVEWDLHYFHTAAPSEDLGDQHLEAGEDIETMWCTPDQAVEVVMAGGMSEDRSAAVLLRYLHSQRNQELSSLPGEEQTIGTAIDSYIKEHQLESLRINQENISDLQEVNSIVFVGSSLAGKSTMIDSIREVLSEDPQLAEAFSIPKRIVTRPQRENDNLQENIFRTPEEFIEMTDSGEVSLSWVRKMEKDRTEKYGFEPAKPNTIPIYSANNAIINNQETVLPPGELTSSLVISVYAPDKTREERLLDRSPDLVADKPEEAAYRLSDKAINMYPHAHIQVNNFGRFSERTPKDVVHLLRGLVVEAEQ